MHHRLRSELGERSPIGVDLAPHLLRAALTPKMPPGVAIAAVTTTGYFGFLSEPPLIGFAADTFTLRAALGIIVILSAMIALLAQTLLRAATSQAATSDTNNLGLSQESLKSLVK